LADDEFGGIYVLISTHKSNQILRSIQFSICFVSGTFVPAIKSYKTTH